MIPVIETTRLRLREWRLSDFDAYAALRTDADLQRHSGGARTPAQAWEEFCAAPGQWALLGHGVFLVADRAHDTPLGFAGLWHPPDLHEPELCWSLFPGNTGRGYATEAAAAALRWCFDEGGLPARWLSPASTISCTAM